MLDLFEELMTYKETVFRICLGFSKDPTEAEDLTQDVYLKAYVNLDSLKNPTVKRQWLFRIARNTCLDHVRKLRRRPSIDSHHPTDTENNPHSPDLTESANPYSPETITDHFQQLEQLKSTISNLPNKLRDVFVLKEYGHLSYQEIADSLGIKTGTVMSRLNRARQTVIKKMKHRETV